jgi:hypothetical protein
MAQAPSSIEWHGIESERASEQATGYYHYVDYSEKAVAEE